MTSRDRRRFRRCKSLLADIGGLTADEIDALEGWDMKTASRFMSELHATDVIRKTGKFRMTRRGRPAAVFELVP